MHGQNHIKFTQYQFYPDMSNVNKNITMEAKLISPPTYVTFHLPVLYFTILAKICMKKLIVKYIIYRIVHLLGLIEFENQLTIHGMNNMKVTAVKLYP